MAEYKTFKKKRRDSPKKTIRLFCAIVTHSVLLCNAAIGHFRWARLDPKWPWTKLLLGFRKTIFGKKRYPCHYWVSDRLLFLRLKWVTFGNVFNILPYFPQRNLAFLNKYLRPKSPQGCFRQNFYFHRWSSTPKRNMSIIIFHRVFFEVAEKENSLGVNQFHSFWNILHPRFWR